MSAARDALVREVAAAIHRAAAEYYASADVLDALKMRRDDTDAAYRALRDAEARAAIRAVGEAAVKVCADDSGWEDCDGSCADRIRDLTGAGDA